MTTPIIVSLISIILAILGHAAASIWWASQITAAIKGFNDSLTRIDKELEKRDINQAAAWKRIDEINAKVIVLETKSRQHAKSNN